MLRSPRSKRFLGALCAGLLALTAVAPASAGMVGTDAVLADVQVESERARLMAALDRDAVRAELEALGVDPAQAEARVARLTDAEIAQLQGRIDEAVAGGDALTVALIVFIVFIVTDVIGATDIFPFVRPVN